MQSAEHLTRAALAAAHDESAEPVERAQMLVQLAMGLQRRPKTRAHLEAAIRLYDAALALCPPAQALLVARITARKGTALQALPEEGTGSLEEARALFEQAIPRLMQPEEIAEAEMNLGLVLQHLAGCGRAKMADAVAAYQRALRTFERKRFPVEFAILQNNLATAFLAMPLAGERGRIREALAVQCFEEGLKAVTLIDHPVEYAMLQNNLGNALQYAPSSHARENHLRALAAYDEALRVRTRAATPIEYANTLANKANCLRNLGSRDQAKACYAEAREIFSLHGEVQKARLVGDALAEIE